jgi:hypothetical protein
MQGFPPITWGLNVIRSSVVISSSLDNKYTAKPLQNHLFLPAEVPEVVSLAEVRERLPALGGIPSRLHQRFALRDEFVQPPQCGSVFLFRRLHADLRRNDRASFNRENAKEGKREKPCWLNGYGNDAYGTKENRENTKTSKAKGNVNDGEPPS